MVFNKPFASQAEAVKALQGFAIVVGMRERTPFPKAVIEALPDLKLLITTGMRNNSFDVAAANARGVIVCGTGAVGSPTTGIAFGLMLELTRRIGFENARLKSGAGLAGDARPRPRRLDARRPRPRQAGRSARPRSARPSA